MKLGSINLSKMYVGVSEVIKAYIGSTQTYSNDPYYVGNFLSPELTFDFGNEYYRTDGTDTTFPSAITHSRASNATMVDNDGLLKWAPHNLLTYSEDLSEWIPTNVSVTTNSIASPDGTITADLIVPLVTSADGTYIRKTGITGSHGTSISTYVKASGVNVVWGYMQRTATYGVVYFDLSDQTIQAVAGSSATPVGSIEDAGDGWYLITVSIAEDVALISPYGNGFGISDAKGSFAITKNASNGVYIWGAHLYRSDLGGMVNNPDRGDSYVPTTSAARYLPRRGHHVYNGASWVNEGLLHESEARTNLLTYSEDFTDTAWTKNSVTTNFVSSTNPAGESSVVELTESSTDAVHFAVASTPGVSTGYYTWSLFAKLSTGTRYIQIRTGGAGVYANFDLSTGAVVDSGGPYIVFADIVDFGDGWYRCVVSGNFGVVPSGAQIIMSNGTGAAPSYLGDGTSSILIYGAQFEQGSTPSSYIPTSGSTATRAAETLTVSSANLPWNTFYGEFVPALSWTGVDWESFTTTDDSFSGEKSVGGGTDHAYSNAYVSVVAGQKVKIEVDFTAGTNTVVTIGLSVTTNARSEQIAVDPSAGGTFTVEVTPILSGTFSISVRTTTLGTVNVTGARASISNADPISIQMDGRMTYADDDAENNAVTFLNWEAGSEQISYRIRTDSTRTGSFQVLQRTGGTLDIVEGTLTDYAPGINVPFSVASRHGTTFLQGATGGASTSENTTPTAFPDLETVDIDLLPKFNGTVKTLKLWDSDISTSGIEEASS